MEEKSAQFKKLFPGVELSRPLAEVSSFQVGGPADLFYELEDINQLPSLMEAANRLDIARVIIGGGSNVIFHDNGFRGLIIRIKANKIRIEGEIIVAEAGAFVSKVIQTAQQNNLIGLHKLIGIPGTIGGAVRGNAGAQGMEICEVIDSAKLYDSQKGIFEAKKEYFEFGYRHSKIKQNQEILLEVQLKLTKNDDSKAKEESQKEVEEILKARIGRQPTGKTCGSFFKNPNPDLGAGYLLDQCGCKGLQVGRAQVSYQHANWILNLGRATQKHVIDLARMMSERVIERYDIELVPEVQLIGEEGFLVL